MSRFTVLAASALVAAAAITAPLATASADMRPMPHRMMCGPGFTRSFMIIHHRQVVRCIPMRHVRMNDHRMHDGYGPRDRMDDNGRDRNYHDGNNGY